MLAFAALGLVHLASPIAAQDGAPAAPRYVDLPVRMEVGFRRSLVIVRHRDRWKSGQLVESVGSTTPVEIAIVGAGESGYVCRWTYGAAKFESSDARALELAARFEALTTGLTSDIRLDPSGSVVGLANEVTARRQLDQSLALFRKEFAANAGASPELLEKFDAAMSAALSALRGPAFEATLLREPSMFLAWCGGSYELGATVDYEDRIPNPFGGEPFPSSAHLCLAELRSDETEAVLTWSQALDPERTSALLRESYNELRRKLGQPATEPGAFPTFDVQDQGEFVFDLTTGWPKSASWSRTTASADSKRRDTVRITTLPGAAK